VLNDISARHTVGLYWGPGYAGVQGNAIAYKLARGGSTQKFIGPEPSLGGLDRILKVRLNAGWITNIW